MKTWVLVLGLIITGAPSTWAIQAESQTEKEANLKGQALGGLFNRWTFDQQKPDETPAGFSALNQAGEGASQWIIHVDDEAPSPPNVLRAVSACQSATCSRLLVADKLLYEYPDVAVRLRFPEEGGAGVGGLVIELKDAANFYAALVDLSKKQLQIIRVADGKETVLGQTAITPKAVTWHSLRVQRDTIISKDVINAYFDGLLVLSVRDQTFSQGQVGIMAQGKSSLLFDSLHAVPLFSQRPLSNPAAY